MLNKMVTVGMKDADACLREMFKNDFAPETIVLLENIESLRTLKNLEKLGLRRN